MGKKVFAIKILPILALGIFLWVHLNGEEVSPKSHRLDDPLLGHMVMDRENRWWTGRVIGDNRRSIELSINAEPSGLKKRLHIAREFYRKTQKNDVYFRREAAKYLLDIYNQNWNADKAIDTFAFMKRLDLMAIFVGAKGNIQLFYDDGGMFSGHIVVIDVDRNGKVTNADIAG